MPETSAADEFGCGISLAISINDVRQVQGAGCNQRLASMCSVSARQYGLAKFGDPAYSQARSGTERVKHLSSFLR
jgi:hypothetical protein